jgi:hypothetical protein
MWGRVSHGMLRNGSVEQPVCRWLAALNASEFLQLNRLVRVISNALDYRFPKRFCA